MALTPERALELGRRAAGRFALGDPDLDDLAQEGALRAMRAAELHPELGEGHYLWAAKQRVKDKIKHRTWTGQDASTGTPVDPLRRPHSSTDEIFAEVGDGETAERVRVLFAVEDRGFEEAEWRAMAREHIDQAVEHLFTDDQRTVVRNVERGVPIKDALPGKSRSAAWGAWYRAKAQLQQELGWMTDDEGRIAA